MCVCGLCVCMSICVCVWICVCVYVCVVRRRRCWDDALVAIIGSESEVDRIVTCTYVCMKMGVYVCMVLSLRWTGNRCMYTYLSRLKHHELTQTRISSH